MRSVWIAPFVVLSMVTLGACGDDDPALPSAGYMADPILQIAANQTLQLQGLPAGADVVFDEIGMPHIYAPDMETTIFMQGYITASMRFWEMDVFRRFATGRLAELFGPTILSQDVQIRTIFTTRDGRRLQEALWEDVQRNDPETTRILESYAAGVNAWLSDLRSGRNGVTLPPEYGVPLVTDLTVADITDWQPSDTLAIGRLQAYSLSESLGSEIEAARVRRLLPEAMVRDVYRSAPASPATVLPVASAIARAAASPPVEDPAQPSLEVLSLVETALAQLREANPLQRGGDVGSNNWIIAPRLSANGHAMLANDPHLSLYNPPIWHLIQLNVGTAAAPREQLTGVMFPGLPGVILGHNAYGAWGGTVAVFDVTDVYVEEVQTPTDYPASPRTVRFKGELVPVLRIEETFNIKRRGPVKQIIEVVPHHGPMVPDPNISDAVVGLAATGMSVRWTGHEISNDARFLLDLGRARSVAEFRDALRSFAVGAQNWVWADVNGDIAYFPKVLIPQRPAGVIPYLPVPGTGEAEWLRDSQGNMLWLPDDKIPQATNPPEGYLATSNNDQIGNTLDNDPLNDAIFLTYSADLGFRQERILELLSNRASVRPAGAKISREDMSRYQYDTSSKEAARLLPLLFAAAQRRTDLLTSEMASAVARLREWGETKPNSPPYDMVSGIDAHELRPDAAPRPQPVSAEERSDAVAATIYTGWLTRLSRGVFADDFQGTGVGAPSGADATKALLHITEDLNRDSEGFRVHTKGASGESTLWDNKTTAAVETSDEVILTALRDGLTYLSTRFEAAPVDAWLWGKVHQVRLQHFISQAGIGIFDLGPFAAPGGRYTVNPANYGLNSDNWTFSGGPSKRFVAVLDPAGIRSFNSLPGGNNGNPGGVQAEKFNTIDPATHYGDLLPGWINGQTFEYHVTRDAVAAHAVKRIIYTP